MTKEEAEKLLMLMTKADGGCRYCAEDLMQGFSKIFPDYKELAKQVYKNKFDKELNLDD